jgi:DNA polymerase III delta prime subunit
MAANPQIVTPQPVVHHLEKKMVNVTPVPTITIPTKLAIFGEQGTGKTTTACLYAASISKEFYNGAPVWGTDPELGMQFPKRTIFMPEKIEFVQRTVPTFQAMLQDMRDAERAGACVWIVELQKIWIELLKTVRKKSANNWGNELNALWTDYVAHFLNSKMHCIALGRVGDVTDDLIDDRGEITKVKTGEKMKAGGSNNFGYEPHLVLRMKLEQKPRRKDAQAKDGEGRMNHVAYVLKDRTWALNGLEFRWPDKISYKPRGYMQVWQSLKPHFMAVQETMGFVQLDTLANSEAMIDNNGNGEFYRERERKATISAEIKACMDLHFAGRGKEDVQVRIAISELIFGVKSKEAADALPLEKLERGLRILHAYEKLPSRDLTSGETILKQIAECVREYDLGQSEEWEVPF